MAEIVKGHRTYYLTVDYGCNVEELLETGHYGGHTDSGILNENFPVTYSYKKRIKLELILFGENLLYNQVLNALKQMSYRPANAWELLTLGEKRPKALLKGCIVALGSAAKDPHLTRYRHLGALSFLYLFCEGVHNLSYEGKRIILSRQEKRNIALRHRSAMLLYHTDIGHPLHCWIAAVRQ